MCGLPSAVGTPERHALCANALDGYEPAFDLYDERLGRREPSVRAPRPRPCKH